MSKAFKAMLDESFGENASSLQDYFPESNSEESAPDTSNDSVLDIGAKAVGRGAANTAGGIARFLGADETADTLSRYAQQWRDPLNEQSKAELNWDYVTNPHRMFSDALDQVGSTLTLAPLAALVPEGAAGAGAGAIVGGLSKIAPKAAPWIGAWLEKQATEDAIKAGLRWSATGLGESMSEGGNAYDQAIEKGYTPEQARNISYEVAAKNAPTLAVSQALEGALLGGGLLNFGAKEGESTLARMAKAPLRATPSIMANAQQQGLEEAAQDAITSSAFGEDYGVLPWNWNQEQIDDYGRAVGGSIFMGAIPGTYNAARGIRNNSTNLGNEDTETGEQNNLNDVVTTNSDVDVSTLNDDFSSRLAGLASAYQKKFGVPLNITSATEGQHVEGSDHYNGNAADVASDAMDENPEHRAWIKENAGKFGINVYDEYENDSQYKSGDHLHLSMGDGEVTANSNNVDTTPSNTISLDDMDEQEAADIYNETAEAIRDRVTGDEMEKVEPLFKNDKFEDTPENRQFIRENYRDALDETVQKHQPQTAETPKAQQQQRPSNATAGIGNAIPIVNKSVKAAVGAQQRSNPININPVSVRNGQQNIDVNNINGRLESTGKATKATMAGTKNSNVVEPAQQRRTTISGNNANTTANLTGNNSLESEMAFNRADREQRLADKNNPVQQAIMAQRVINPATNEAPQVSQTPNGQTNNWNGRVQGQVATPVRRDANVNRSPMLTNQGTTVNGVLTASKGKTTPAKTNARQTVNKAQVQTSPEQHDVNMKHRREVVTAFNKFCDSVMKAYKAKKITAQDAINRVNNEAQRIAESEDAQTQRMIAAAAGKVVDNIRKEMAKRIAATMGMQSSDADIQQQEVNNNETNQQQKRENTENQPGSNTTSESSKVNAEQNETTQNEVAKNKEVTSAQEEQKQSSSANAQEDKDSAEYWENRAKALNNQQVKGDITEEELRAKLNNLMGELDDAHYDGDVYDDTYEQAKETIQTLTPAKKVGRQQDIPYNGKEVIGTAADNELAEKMDEAAGEDTSEQKEKPAQLSDAKSPNLNAQSDTEQASPVKDSVAQNEAESESETLSDKSSTGEVVRIGDKVYKGTKYGDKETLEAEVYKKLRGSDVIADGKLVERNGKQQIETPYFKYIVSRDSWASNGITTRKAKAIIEKNWRDMLKAVKQLSEAGYDYNDLLQFGYDEKAMKVKLMDFSMAKKAKPKKAIVENLSRLARLFGSFSMENLADKVDDMVDALNYVEAMQQSLEKHDDLENDLVAISLRSDGDKQGLINVATSGIQANNMYYSTNGRAVELKDIAQTNDVGNGVCVFSEKPLTKEQQEEWELMPVYESEPESNKQDNKEYPPIEPEDLGEQVEDVTGEGLQAVLTQLKKAGIEVELNSALIRVLMDNQADTEKRTREYREDNELTPNQRLEKYLKYAKENFDVSPLLLSPAFSEKATEIKNLIRDKADAATVSKAVGEYIDYAKQYMKIAEDSRSKDNSHALPAKGKQSYVKALDTLAQFMDGRTELNDENEAIFVNASKILRDKKWAFPSTVFLSHVFPCARLQAKNTFGHSINRYDRNRILKKIFGSYDEAQFIRTAKGEVLGLFDGKKIILDENKLGANTAVHEYTHFWDAIVQTANPKLWKQGVELMKQTPLWDKIANSKAYSHIANDDDKIASEVHARLSANDGTLKLAELEKAGHTSKEIISKLADWVKEFWNALKSSFAKWSDSSVNDLTVEQFVNMPMRDLFGNTRGLKKQVEQYKQDKTNTTVQAKYSVSEDTGKQQHKPVTLETVKEACKGALVKEVKPGIFRAIYKGGHKLYIHAQERVILTADEEVQARRDHKLPEDAPIFVNGAQQGNTIDLSNYAEDGTIHHELEHWAERFMTKAQLDALKKYFGDAEARADGYKQYRNNPRKYSGIIGKACKVIDDVVNTALRIFGDERAQAEHVMSQIESGEIFNQQENSLDNADENGNNVGKKFDIAEDMQRRIDGSQVPEVLANIEKIHGKAVRDFVDAQFPAKEELLRLVDDVREVINKMPADVYDSKYLADDARKSLIGKAYSARRMFDNDVSFTYQKRIKDKLTAKILFLEEAFDYGYDSLRGQNDYGGRGNQVNRPGDRRVPGHAQEQGDGNYDAVVRNERAAGEQVGEHVTGSRKRQDRINEYGDTLKRWVQEALGRMRTSVSTAGKSTQGNNNYQGAFSFTRKLADTLAEKIGLKVKVPQGVNVQQKKQDSNHIDLVDAILKSPARYAEKDVIFARLYNWADKAMDRLTSNRNFFSRKMAKAYGLLDNDERKDTAYDIFLAEDAQGKVLTEAEMRQMGADDNVIAAHKQIRNLLEKAYNMLNNARKQPKKRNQKKTESELKELKQNPFVKIDHVEHIGQDDNGSDVYQVTYTETPHIAEGLTFANKQAYDAYLQNNPGTTVLMAGRKNDGSYNVKVVSPLPDLGHIAGYIPHFFHDFKVEIRDADGKLVQIIDSGRTQAEAIQRADAWLNDKNNKLAAGNEIYISPKIMSFGEMDNSYAPIMGDKDYDAMVHNLAKNSDMKLKDAKELMDGAVARKGRNRVIGNVLKRKGAKGYEQDLDWVFRHYFNSVSRYEALQTEFKPNAINLFERRFGAFDKDWSGRAKYFKDYINDVNGTPSALEKLLNEAVNSNPFFQKYIVPRYGERAALSLVNGVTGRVSYLTLGCLNVSSALLNVSQLVNSAAYLSRAKGGVDCVPLLGRMLAKGLHGWNGYTMEEKKILKAAGVLESIGLDSNGYDANRGIMGAKGVLGKIDYLGSKGMALFSISDGVCRRGTILAAYKVARAEGKSKEEAINYAKEIDRKANFEYGVQDAPNVFRRGSVISQLMLQFKKYGFKEMEVVSDMLSDKTTASQKAGFWGMYFLMCGLMGLPAIDWWDDVAQKFGFYPKDFIQSSVMKVCGKNHKKLGEVAMYGSSALANINVSARAGLSDVIPTRTSDFLGATLSKTVNAVGDTASGNYANAIRDVSPGVYNIYSAYTGKNTGKRGRVNTRYENNFERGLRLAGFKSVNESVVSDTERIIKDDKSKLRSEKQAAIDRFIENPTSENRRTLERLGVKPETVKEERKKKKMNRAERLNDSLTKEQRKDHKNLLEFSK